METKKIGKEELIKRVSENTASTKKVTSEIVNAVFNEIGASLQKGENVTITGFGSFKPKKQKAKTGVNPQTKEPIKIPARIRVCFTAGKPLKDLVNTKAKKKTKIDLTKKSDLNKKVDLTKKAK